MTTTENLTVALNNLMRAIREVTYENNDGVQKRRLNDAFFSLNNCVLEQVSQNKALREALQLNQQWITKIQGELPESELKEVLAAGIKANEEALKTQNP